MAQITASHVSSTQISKTIGAPSSTHGLFGGGDGSRTTTRANPDTCPKDQSQSEVPCKSEFCSITNSFNRSRAWKRTPQFRSIRPLERRHSSRRSRPDWISRWIGRGKTTRGKRNRPMLHEGPFLYSWCSSSGWQNRVEPGGRFFGGQAACHQKKHAGRDRNEQYPISRFHGNSLMNPVHP